MNFGDLHGIFASFGVTEIRAAGYDMDDVYNIADEALYESKRSGKNQIHFGDDAQGDSGNV